MVMGPGDKSEKAVAVEKLATDGSNWPLWRATMLSFFESKNLLRHIEGTAVKPPGPVIYPKGTALTEDQEVLQDRAEERLEKYLAREGLVKTQVIISVSESLALMLQKKSTAKELWDTLVTEMTKKPKMVVTSLQRQLRNIKCSEEDDLREHLDKAQDLYARLNEMGAMISEEEFMDIILASLPPSYEAVMNALTTSLQECDRPLEPDNIIRVLKAQYDKRKVVTHTHDEEVFMGSTKKKGPICANCHKSGHTIENCWAKGGGKEGQGPKQKKRKQSKKKKGKYKANAADEASSSEDEENGNTIAFINIDCAALIKDGSGSTVIIDTGASSHMTPHKNLLKDYQCFPKPRTIRAANKASFNAFGTGTLFLTTNIKGKPVEIMLKNTLYAPETAFTLISIGKCDDARYHTEFGDQKCTIKSSAGKVLLQAPKLYGLYRLDHLITDRSSYQSLSAMEVHKKLGHISQKSLRYLLNHGMVLGIEMKSMNDKISCDACIKSKITRKPLPKESRDHAKTLGERVYSDVWGPSRHLTINKKSYYVSFIDDCSRESVIYLMNSKDQVFQKYKLYAAMMLRQWNVHIKTLVSDQ